MLKVKYNKDYHREFQTELRKNVQKYFQKTNQPRTCNQVMIFKTLFFFLWMIAGYVILFTAQTFWQTLTGYLISGSGALFTVITVGHDASHRAFSKNQRINKLLSYSWGLLGLSNYLWEIKHHHSHHAFTNIIKYDQDISQSKLIRMNPADPYHRHHQYQKYYVIILYLLFGIFAVTYREFKLYFVREYGNTVSRHGPRLLLSIIALKIFYFGLNLAIPLWLIPLPAWQIILCLFIMMSLVGFYIILVLAIPHINQKSIYKSPAENGIINTDWYTHALQVTVDASPESRLVNWFTGGLNTHVVHHIFPNICHIHYRKLTPIVASTAEKFGIPYKKQSLWALIKNHFEALAAFGIDPKLKVEAAK